MRYFMQDPFFFMTASASFTRFVSPLREISALPFFDDDHEIVDAAQGDGNIRMNEAVFRFDGRCRIGNSIKVFRERIPGTHVVPEKRRADCHRVLAFFADCVVDRDRWSFPVRLFETFMTSHNPDTFMGLNGHFGSEIRECLENLGTVPCTFFKVKVRTECVKT